MMVIDGQAHKFQVKSSASPRLTWLSSYYLYSDSSMSAANGMGAQGSFKASG
jgi:hypothetical protein